MALWPPLPRGCRTIKADMASLAIAKLGSSLTNCADSSRNAWIMRMSERATWVVSLHFLIQPWRSLMLK